MTPPETSAKPETATPLRPGETVRDEQNREYRVEELIGTGGQGDVWRLEGGRGAVKVLRVVDADTGRKLREQLRWIARTDFSGIPLAPPIALLAERPGYAMDLADGMSGLGSLFRPPRGQDQRLWYRDTGGLRRRLLVLGRLAFTGCTAGRSCTATFPRETCWWPGTATTSC
jgi:hypothetical protein